MNASVTTHHTEALRESHYLHQNKHIYLSKYSYYFNIGDCHLKNTSKTYIFIPYFKSLNLTYFLYLFFW
jgi:hypothetical protein